MKQPQRIFPEEDLESSAAVAEDVFAFGLHNGAVRELQISLLAIGQPPPSRGVKIAIPCIVAWPSMTRLKDHEPVSFFVTSVAAPQPSLVASFISSDLHINQPVQPHRTRSREFDFSEPIPISYRNEMVMQ
ncbi:hypothetical protein [Bradyrhizobium japonicum]|uniref:hypothetical protein n=1 Tax=Bradyrhizobium japonicum TaxID=375 RepID=UPI00142F3490|nr:hypothetical protein [Bradyrhizobium japonicum]